LISYLESHSDEILPTLKLRAEIKKLALTLYLGESDMVSFILKIDSRAPSGARMKCMTQNSHMNLFETVPPSPWIGPFKVMCSNFESHTNWHSSLISYHRQQCLAIFVGKKRKIYTNEIDMCSLL
jgi:hypothetical protein